MAKNSNEWMLGSLATIDRLSTADSVDLRKIVNGNLAPLLVVVFTLSVTIAMYSQVTDATLSGTTTDPFGGAIPGAQMFDYKYCYRGTSKQWILDNLATQPRDAQFASEIIWKRRRGRDQF